MTEAAAATTTTTQADPAPQAATSSAPATPSTSEAGKSWIEGLTSETLRGSPSFARYKTLDEFANGFMNLEKSLGVPVERRIDIPADPADAEGMRAVLTKLGLPDKPEGYALAAPEGATDNDKALLSEFAIEAHKAGILPAHVKAVTEFWAARNAAAIEQAKQADVQMRETGDKALKEAFGTAYEPVQAEIDALLEKHFSKDVQAALKREDRALFPGFVKGLASLAAEFREPGSGGPGAAGKPDFGQRPLTPKEATAALAALNGNPEKYKALTTKDHPQHAAVLAERRKLLAWENGQEA